MTKITEKKQNKIQEQRKTNQGRRKPFGQKSRTQQKKERLEAIQENQNTQRRLKITKMTEKRQNKIQEQRNNQQKNQDGRTGFGKNQEQKKTYVRKLRPRHKASTKSQTAEKIFQQQSRTT